MTADRYNLKRFVEAQAPVMEEVLGELRAGRKRSHWIWFIFPQIAGLGSSETARYFAISSVDEAREYLAHPLLGPRLAECCRAVNGAGGRTAEQIFGYPDYLKFRSSITLFREAAEDKQPFSEVLEKYFGGEPDPATLARL